MSHFEWSVATAIWPMLVMLLAHPLAWVPQWRG